MNGELSGALVTLRPPTTDDVDGIFRACQDADTQRYTPVPVPYTKQDAIDFVTMSEEAWRSGSAAVFAISLTNGSYDGAIDLRFGAAKTASVGYSVAPWARRRGVGTDALRTACAWAFHEREIARISWQALVGNWGSRRVAEAVGFRVGGEHSGLIVLRGERYDGWSAELQPSQLLTI